MVVAAVVALCLACGAVAFTPSKAKARSLASLKMAGTPMFDPKEEVGVSPPLGIFDPLGSFLSSVSYLNSYCMYY